MKCVQKRVLMLAVLVLFAALSIFAFRAADVRAAENEATAAVTMTAEEAEAQATTAKARAAAIAIAIVAAAGALSMGIAIAKSNDSIARQPEAGGQIRTGLMLGLVFIETAIIYALIVAILIIFVL